MNANIFKNKMILLSICIFYSCNKPEVTNKYYIDKYINPNALHIKVNQELKNIFVCELDGEIIRTGSLKHEQYALRYGDNSQISIFSPKKKPIIADTCHSINIFFSEGLEKKEILINDYAQIIVASCKYSIHDKQIIIDYSMEKNEIDLIRFNSKEHLLLEGKFLIQLAPPYNTRKGSYKIVYNYNHRLITSNSIIKE